MQDINAPDIPAACTGLVDITQDAHFRRHSTFSAFLPPALCRAREARLRICAETLVARVELERRGGAVRAAGVHIQTADPWRARYTYCVKARREVIVCGGALGSPQILMLRRVSYLRCVYSVLTTI